MSNSNGAASAESGFIQPPWDLEPIIATVNTNPEPGMAIAALHAICETLAIGSEEQLAFVPVLPVAQFLVKSLSCNGTYEETLLAARGIAYLCDSLPSSISTIVSCGTISAICEQLQGMEYLDIAEECVKVLGKIADADPLSCLRGGAVAAVLNLVAFFSCNIQRTAISMVDLSIDSCTEEDAALVVDAVPTLCSMAKHEDLEIADCATFSLLNLVRSFCRSSVLLDELCKRGVISTAIEILSDCFGADADERCINSFELLTIAASYSLQVNRTLLELNVGSVINKYLLLIPDHSNIGYVKAHVFLDLIDVIVPPVAKDAEDNQLISCKENIISDEPNLFFLFAKDILPALVQIMVSGAKMEIRYGCVGTIYNITYFTTSDMLPDLMKNVNISRCLANLLTVKNCHILVPSLKIVDTLMTKLPGYFLDSFVEDGVVNAIDELVLLQSEFAGGSETRLEETLAGHAHNCFCDVLDSHLSSSSSISRSCGVENSRFVELAKAIRATYFAEEVISKVGYSMTIQKIKDSSMELKNGVDLFPSGVYSSSNEANLSSILGRVMRELTKLDSMSPNMFIKSGILRTLVHYLSNGALIQENFNSYNASNDFHILEGRFHTFSILSSLKVDQNGENSFLRIIIRYLQIILSSFDVFPVIRSRTNKSRFKVTDIPAGNCTSSPFLKVCFVNTAQIETDRNEDVLTVDISSSFEDIDQVLWTKSIQKKEQLNAWGMQGQKGKQSSSSKSRKQLINQALSKISTWINKKVSKVVNASQRIDDCVPNYIFFMDGKQLDRSLTLYQNILQQKVTAKTGYVFGPEFWENVHNVTYTRVEELSSADCSELCLRTDMSHCSDGVALLNWPKFLKSTRSLLNEFSVKPEEADFLHDVFFMLKIFESIDRYLFQILFSERKKDFAVGKVKNTEELVKVIASLDVQQEFVNAMLSDKLEQQMKDTLMMKTGRMPSWCTKLMTSFPFLISFESKLKYLFLTTFKSSVSGHGRPENPLHEIFVTNRSNILVSAEKIMAKHSGSVYFIELEYAGEAGIGVGPTVEFYTLVSQEFWKHGLGIWRGDFTSFDCPAISESSRRSLGSGLIATCGGLFPRPFSLTAMSKSKRKKTLKNFSVVINRKFVLLGQIVARAIMDKRILDIPFSRAFYKLILGQELDMFDILSFDPDLGRTLLEFQALVDRKRFFDANAEHSPDASVFSFRDSRIEDLCLEFALPGYPDYTLSSKRNMEMVNIDNLEEYVALVVDATVKSGIAKQIEAFKFGFNKVFPLEALQIFNEAELERLICGEATHWNSSDLQRHVQFDHGYTSESPHAIFFFDIMLELEHDQRRAFLQFLTGSPRLPIGGLGGLSPPFTVVKKFCINEVDEELPSVMTCTNYLKLPAYSSKEVMRRKILYAITEGQGTFQFS